MSETNRSGRFGPARRSAIRAACLAALLCFGSAQAQAPLVRPVMHLEAGIADPGVIRELLVQQLIPVDPAGVERLELHDLGGDGFGEGDVLRILPEGGIHVLRSLSAELQERMRHWEFEANRELHAPRDVSAGELRQADRAVASLLADLLEASRNNLGEGEFEMALDMGGEGLLFRVWDYTADSLYARGLPVGTVRERRRVVDVVEVLRQDTTYIVDKVLHDLLILESQVVDTVYVGAPGK